MKKKIGRNDKCSCGSGKKFKKCCLNKESQFNTPFTPSFEEAIFNFKEIFQEYNTIDLAATIAALSLYPLNHGKNLRIEYLTLEALASNLNSEKIISISYLEKLVTDHFPHHYLEDPPSNLFTENAPFTLGNNVVYGGNFEQGVFTVNTIINAIQFNLNELPKPFVHKTNSAFLLLLTISDMIASRLGHIRNIDGQRNEEGHLIAFPNNINEYKKALFFSTGFIDKIVTDFHLDKTILSLFSLNDNDIFNSKNEIGGDENPLILKPLIQLDNGIFVVSPTTIITALIHFVWTTAEAYSCEKELNKFFHGNVSEELSLYFHKIDFKRINFDFEKNKDLPLKNALFKFDNDKIAYLCFSYDEGLKYSSKSIFHKDPMPRVESVYKLQEKNFQKIKHSFKDYKILELYLYSSIGREFQLMSPKRNDTHSVTTSVYTFLCWLKCDSHDKMSLWYFLEASKRLNVEIYQINPFNSFMELYASYRQNKSFYFNDHVTPDTIIITSGRELEILKAANDKEDKIVVYHKVNDFPHPVLLPVIKYDDYIPRYINKDTIKDQFEWYLPEYPFAVWLRAKNNRIEIGEEHLDLYYQITEAIAYWLTEIRELITTHLKPLKIHRLLINYQILNLYNFDDISLMGIKDINVTRKFSVSIDNDSIYINLPSELISYFSSPDNEGERILLKKILEYLGLLLEKNNLENTLNNQVIDEIIDLKAPLGLKKILLFTHSNNHIALNPRNLVASRYIQESRKQWYMDLVLPLIGELRPPLGEITIKEDKEKLVRNIVISLLKELKTLLREYNSIEVVQRLMESYERHIYENALSTLRTPTRLCCFAEKEDTILEITKQTLISDETTLSLRCLVEHVAAEAFEGTKEMSTQTFDDIMAVMSLIIFWGGYGDRVKYGLHNSELAILPSGRVGTNSGDIVASFFSKFTQKRVEEHVDNTINNFDSYFDFSEGEKIPVPSNFNSAFEDEVGISFEKIGGIIHLLINLGLNQNEKVAKIYVKNLKQEIIESFEIVFSDKEIDCAIKYLALWNRGKVEKTPIGFENIDISPWRYNRKLSYLQRPLVLIDYGVYKDSSIIFWTPRHLEHSWRYLNDLIRSSRYKAKEKGNLEKEISKLSKNRGSIHQAEVKNWVLVNIGKNVEEEVDISPKGKLRHIKDIGDIDILVFDHSKKVILSIECKRTESARNQKEMIEQVDSYYGSGSKKGYFQRHIERHSWLISNISEVGKIYKLDLEGYRVASFFITYEILTIQFMENRTLPIPVFSSFDLKTLSYEELLNKLDEFYCYS